MTVPGALLSFAVVAGLLTVLPGIDTALVVRSVLTRGRRSAATTALGVVTGALVWGGAAAVGASALLAASETAYRVLTLVGAGYLVWLGLRLLLARATPEAAQHHVPSGGRAYVTGLTTNLLNPKVGVFYLATIPQFIPAGVAPLPMGLALAAVHGLLTLVWFALLIQGGRLTARWLRSPRALRVVDRVTGVVLVGFGVRLALETR